MKKDFRSHNLLSELFLWPAFFEHDDCVFLADNFSEEKYHCWLDYFQTLSRGKATVEAILNCVHISELFVVPPAKVTLHLAKEAAETIRTAWRTMLISDLP